MRKIMILNGSPRAKGNTAELIESFTKGAESAGHQVVCFDLQNMNIHGCLGCCRGGKDIDSPCVQKDDMLKIYPVYRECDVIVLATPMYYWSVTGQLKCAFDRLFAVAECDENYTNPKKDCIMLMAAEGASEDNFAPVVSYYESLLKHMQWNDLGMIKAGGVFAVGDIKGHKALGEAGALGKSIK